MKWLSAVSRRAGFEACLDEVSELLRLGEGDSPHLLVLFATPDLIGHYDALRQKLANLCPKALICGCSGSGVIGDGEEVEGSSALSMTAAWLPGVELRTFHVESSQLPDLDAPPQAWQERLLGDGEGLRGMLLFAEPFSLPGDDFLSGLDYAYPGVAKVGGLSSGGQTAGSAPLFGPAGLHRSGVLGVGLFGDIRMDSVVAQGCRPIGRTMVVTDCSYNEVATLDGQLAGNVVISTLKALPPRDQRLASHMLFLGFGAGGPKFSYGPGDFLIRQVLGVQPEEHALVVNARPRVGQTVQLHVRDGQSSSEDLEARLEELSQSCGDLEKVRGALLFSCVGRGRSLYGHPHHDSELFGARVGEVPLGGVFANGELGPVGGTTSLHSFTSCFAVFSEP